MNDEQRKEVVDALVKYVIRVSGRSELKSPEEENALPAIAKLLLQEVSPTPVSMGKRVEVTSCS